MLCMGGGFNPSCMLLLSLLFPIIALTPTLPVTPSAFPLSPVGCVWLIIRYGVAAGQATDHAVNSAINMGVTAFNIDNLGIKAAVKKTGKQTAVAILQDYQLQDPNTNQKQVEKRDK